MVTGRHLDALAGRAVIARGQEPARQYAPQCPVPQDSSADEIASVLIARLIREVQHFVANSRIQEGASADEIWSRFLENLNNIKKSTPDDGKRPQNKPFVA